MSFLGKFLGFVFIYSLVLGVFNCIFGIYCTKKKLRKDHNPPLAPPPLPEITTPTFRV